MHASNFMRADAGAVMHAGVLMHADAAAMMQLAQCLYSVAECPLCFPLRVAKLLGKCLGPPGSQMAQGLPNSSHPCFGIHGDEAFR